MYPGNYFPMPPPELPPESTPPLPPLPQCPPPDEGYLEMRRQQSYQIQMMNYQNSNPTAINSVAPNPLMFESNPEMLNRFYNPNPFAYGVNTNYSPNGYLEPYNRQYLNNYGMQQRTNSTSCYEMNQCYNMMYPHYGYGYPTPDYSTYYAADGDQPGQKRKAVSSIPDDQHEIINSYPKELTAMFQPLYCVLCDSQLNSTTTALMHYSSRNHKKKVNNYLDDWAQKTGEPAPKKLIIDNSKNTFDTRCEDCDLQLTSKQHAQQHYMGRSHQLVIQGRKAPAGSGYYHDGKWIRTSERAASDPSGRFGIGSAFRKPPATSTTSEAISASSSNNITKSTSTNQVISSSNNGTTSTSAEIRSRSSILTSTPNLNSEDNSEAIALGTGPLPSVSILAPMLSSNNIDGIALYAQHPIVVPDSTALIEESRREKPKNTVLYCSLCDCHVTSADQMNMHMAGNRHRKNVQKFGIVQNALEAPADNILASVIIPNVLKSSPKSSTVRGEVPDISVYRTPSGSYYCQPCNITLPTDNQFRQHLSGKKHSQKNSPKK